MASGKCIRRIEIDFFPKRNDHEFKVRGQLLSQRESVGARIPGFSPYFPLLNNPSAVIQGSFKSMPVS
jgi:hypothetical protein